MMIENISMNQSNQIDSYQKIVLDKFEREELFIKAEKLYLTGAKMDSITMYTKCLKNLDVFSTFSSLPKCLRALANHYLEIEDYVKSIHFVQAERMFYESALIDTAALQQKLIDLSYSGKRNDEYLSTNINMKKVDIQKYQARLIEYEHMIRYFINQKKLEMALELAHKTVKLNQMIYGSENGFTKESLCMVHDLKVEIRREKGKEPVNDVDTFNKTHYDYSSTETIAHLIEADESSDLSKLIQKRNLPTTGGNYFSFKEVMKSVSIYFVFLVCIILLIMLVYSLLPILVNGVVNSHIFTVHMHNLMTNINLALQSSFVECRKIVNNLLNLMFISK